MEGALSPEKILMIIAAYFVVLLFISWWTGRQKSNESFFVGKRESPWFVVAFGMIGASLSGVTFISVPGSVGTNFMQYYQVVLGYVVGYVVIATVLMPLYYRLNLTSIYGYLEDRFGLFSYKTGSAFFLLSRVVGAAVRLYLVANVLQITVFNSLGVPFYATVAITILLIWLYTFRGGIKTVIWTDTLQTAFMLIAVGVAIYIISNKMQLTPGELFTTVSESRFAKIFNWDWRPANSFWKQFTSGAFIALVMTGLDQDMMQKNLSCRNIKEAQKNMFSFTAVLVVVNLFFLALGVLLYEYGLQEGIISFVKDSSLAEKAGYPLLLHEGGGSGTYMKTDDLFPILATGGYLGPAIGVFFILGLVAAAYSSADSALTSLTTAFCVDFLNFEKRKFASERQSLNTRYIVHITFSVVLMATILIFWSLNNDAVIWAVFKLAGFTYGPLLGLYAFGILTRLPVVDKAVPFICLLAIVASYLFNEYSAQLLGGYQVGFEILLVNGALTFIGLLISSIFARKNDGGRLNTLDNYD